MMKYYGLLLLILSSYSFAAHVPEAKLQAEAKQEADAPIYVPNNLRYEDKLCLKPEIFDWIIENPQRINARIITQAAKDVSLFQYATIFDNNLAFWLLEQGYVATSPLELLTAIKVQNPNILGKMLEKGANPNVVSDNGRSTLMEALHYFNLNHIRLLITYGANINYKNAQDLNKTILMYVIERSNNGKLHDIIKFLLEHGADPNAFDANGKSVMHYAQNTGNKAIEDLIAEYKNRHREAKKTDATFIELTLPQDIGKVVAGHMVAPTGKDAIYQSIKQAIKDKAPLSYKTRLELSELIANKENLELRDQLGYTPLLLAVYEDKPQLVTFLLEQGANPNAAAQGLNARKLAEHFGYKKVVEAIDDFMAKKKK